MKKALANTRVSVKLRKSEYREEWYLYVEAYPVFQADKPTPQRVREYLNRTITTPIWDKSLSHFGHFMIFSLLYNIFI